MELSLLRAVSSHPAVRTTYKNQNMIFTEHARDMQAVLHQMHVNGVTGVSGRTS